MTENVPPTAGKDAGQKWLVWMWRYHSLDVDFFDSEREAIAYAVAVLAAGDGSLECVEGPGGIVPDDVIEAAQDALYEAERAEWAAVPKNTHRVDVVAPDGKHKAVWGGYTSLEAAEAVADELRPQLGSRVRVERTGTS